MEKVRSNQSKSDKGKCPICDDDANTDFTQHNIDKDAFWFHISKHTKNEMTDLIAGYWWG